MKPSKSIDRRKIIPWDANVTSCNYVYKVTFFAAGSRSHEKLMLSKANEINPQFHEVIKDMGYNIKRLAAKEAQAA